METPEGVLHDVGDRLRKTWSQVVGGADWRPEFRLGTSGLTGPRLAASWGERWERFGEDHDHTGKSLGPRVPRDTSRLEAEELELYLALLTSQLHHSRSLAAN